jgi:hypothetical protein
MIEPLAHPAVWKGDDGVELSGTSLDHTIWFHRPMRSDVWHLHDVTCQHFTASRGLALGHVFTAEGEHVATFAQEGGARQVDHLQLARGGAGVEVVLVLGHAHGGGSAAGEFGGGEPNRQVADA